MSLAHEIIYGTHEGVQRLLEAGENVDGIDDYGFTPLIEAAIVNSVEIAETLLKAGARINLSDATGRTPLHWAVDNSNLPLAKLLLAKGADANAATSGAQPVLANPLLRNQQALKKLLYQYGADLNFAQDFINAKLLGHRYQLLGQVDILNQAGVFLELDFEGFYLEFTLEIVRNSLERYRNNFAARHMRVYFDYIGTIIDAYSRAAQLLKYQHYTIDIKQHRTEIDALLGGELLLIPVAYEGHAITFVKYRNLLVRCDRGENSKREGTVVIYQISNLRFFNKEYIKWLIYKQQSREFITEGIKEALGLVPVLKLPLAPQVIGNCSWSNVEAAIPAMLFLLMLGENPRPDRNYVSECEHAALKFFHDWMEWDQDRALEECIKSFNRSSRARKASKAALLAAILFQQCRYRVPKDLQKAEQIFEILTLPDYQYILKSYLEIYCKQRKTDAGNNLLQLMDLCGVRL